MIINTAINNFEDGNIKYNFITYPLNITIDDKKLQGKTQYLKPAKFYIFNSYLSVTELQLKKDTISDQDRFLEFNLSVIDLKNIEGISYYLEMQPIDNKDKSLYSYFVIRKTEDGYDNIKSCFNIKEDIIYEDRDLK